MFVPAAGMKAAFYRVAMGHGFHSKKILKPDVPPPTVHFISPGVVDRPYRGLVRDQRDCSSRADPIASVRILLNAKVR